jgi:hypothetical protein
MSDDLPLEILKTLNFERFRNLIRVDTDHCDKYIRRQTVSEKDVVLTAHLPYECVRGWSSTRQEALAKQIPCSYIQIFNAFVYARSGFKVRNDSQRVEERLRKLASEIKAKFVGKSGHAYRMLCQKEVSVALQMMDLVRLSETNAELNEQKLINERHQKEKNALKDKSNIMANNMGEAKQAQRRARHLARTQILETEKL